jgi:glycosyltransferase involved in cell wall biosynthesis
VTTLKVILDQLAAPVPGGIGRYTAELTRELISTAEGAHVEGVIAAASADSRSRVAATVPGLDALTSIPWDRRILSRAWSRGVRLGRPAGHIHAPSLFAPVVRPLRRSDRLVVTIHDVVPWTHPQTLTPHGVRWHRAMAARAQRWADAVVVDTAAVAEQLAEHLDFGERVHVIGAAVSTDLVAPTGVVAERRARELGLPPRYVLSVGTLEPRKGLDHLIDAMAHVAPGDVPLLIAGPSGWGDVRVDDLARDAGLAPGRVRVLGRLDDADLALAYSRATVFAFPSLAEGFGLPVLEAFQAGAPVVHSDDPAVSEVAAGAGVQVERSRPGYAERLAVAIDSLLADDSARNDAISRGRRRVADYSWQTTARSVWALHRSL